MKTGFITLLMSSLLALLLAPGCARHNASAKASPAIVKVAPATDPRSAAPADPQPTAASTDPKPSAATPGEAAPAQPEKPSAATNLQDRASYAIGMSIANNLKRQHLDVTLDQVTQGMKDVLDNQHTRFTEMEAQRTIMEYVQQRSRILSAKDRKIGQAFMEQNKTKPGVRVLSVSLPGGKTAQMEYKILTQGTGAVPSGNDMVSIRYTGKLLNGTEIDSTARRGGRPTRFALSQAPVRGWAEALGKMPAGSKWELVIPPSLAYGDRPLPTIPPGSTLIYEMELLSVQKAKPMTSDIIRVPSAAEMKAGAKPEIIKPEEAEKMAASATNHVTSEKK